jgi:nitrite reductase (NO-forming)
MKRIFLLALLASTVALYSFVDVHYTAQPDPLKASMQRGKLIYESSCITCHMERGEGLEGTFPPLAKSDYLMADKKRAIRQLIKGVKGKMVVNGKTYNGEMAAQGLTDQQNADVMNYILNSWGNKAPMVTLAEAKAERK